MIRPWRGVVGWLIVATLLPGCDEEAPLDPAARAGALELGRVVGVGDGFMAGATDDALYASAQRYSPLALFAHRVAGDDQVLQPLVVDPGFALGEDEGGRLELVSISPTVTVRRLPRGGPLLEPPPSGPYQNLAVPGALLVESLTARSEATSLLGNPFYDLVLRDRGPVAEQVAEADATLVLLWYGTGDVLPWVAQGGDSGRAPGLPTPAGTFASIYERLLDRVMETTDQVALFTVPDVTLLPVVHAIPPFVTDSLGEPETITRLVPEIDPETGEPIVDADGDTVKVAREFFATLIGPEGDLGEDDLVTLEARPLLDAGIGVPTVFGGTGEPLPDRAVLDAGERAVARTEIALYNAAIRRLAEDRDLALVDVEALVETLAGEGVVSDGVRVTDAWVFGQAVGLDGAHFTPKGNGIVVNLLVDALNARYGARLPHVRTADLPGMPLLRFDRRGPVLDQGSSR